MPELPEVETMVRGVRPHFEGRKIAAVRRCRCACKPISITPSLRSLARRMIGRTVTRIRRIGKRVVLELSSQDLLVIEPRMTGLLLLGDPPDRQHLRLQWQFDGKAEFNAFWFWDRRGLGTVRLFQPAEFARQFGRAKLGPDALEMSIAEWRTRCRGTKRSIKVALMDQKFIAGIGNLYASEILHAARIHPETPANELPNRKIQRLSQATEDVLEEAIRCEGSTLSDATYRNTLNQAGGYQNLHRVYGRAERICPTCRAVKIRRIVQTGRSTFFCPRCQAE